VETGLESLDDSRVSKAFSSVCDVMCMYREPHDKTKAAETEIAKLAFTIPLPGQKVKGQNYKVTRCKGDQVTGVMHSIECPASS